MIDADQPTIFGSAVKAAISSKGDGNMKFGIGDEADVYKNRLAFLKTAGIDIDHTTLVAITYDTDDFTKYRVVDGDEKSTGMHSMDNVIYADALVTKEPNRALFLPLADCVGAIIYDAEHHALMVSHIGRHSAEMDGGLRSVKYLEDAFGSDPAQLKVWLSPGVGRDTYPLHRFGGKGLQDVILDQLQAAGVSNEHVETSHIDTAKSKEYYSHSEYLKGSDEQGRFAIVAEMREQGEPAL